MRYDLSDNSIVGNCDYASFIERIDNDKKRLDRLILSDLFSLVADGTWEGFIGDWSYQDGNTADAIAHFVRLISNARVAERAVRASKNPR